MYRFLFLLALAAALPARAQSPEVPALPPVEAVVAAVVARAPGLAAQRANVAKNEAQLARARRDWLDRVAVTVGSQAGSYGNALLNTLNVGGTVGVSVRLSLYDVLGGRARGIDAVAQEVAIAAAKRDEAVDELRITTLALYRRLDLAARLVTVRADAVASAGAHRTMAEAQFRQSEIPIAELARVEEIEASAKAAFETARADYLTAYQQLEVLAGVPLASLVPPAPATTPAAPVQPVYRATAGGQP